MTDRERAILEKIRGGVIDQQVLFDCNITLAELQGLKSNRWVTQRSEFYAITKAGRKALQEKDYQDTPYKMALSRTYDKYHEEYKPAPHPMAWRFK